MRISILTKISRLCQEFSISIPTLSSFQNPADRHKYIVECMQKRVREDLKELDKKHIVRLNHVLQNEEEFQKNKVKSEKDTSDIFKWLDINTS